MTKRDLVVRIAGETGLIQSTVGGIVQKTLDYIADELAAGRNVELRNFGVFEIRRRKSSKGRNPKVPQIMIDIPEELEMIIGDLIDLGYVVHWDSEDI